MPLLFPVQMKMLPVPQSRFMLKPAYHLSRFLSWKGKLAGIGPAPDKNNAGSKAGAHVDVNDSRSFGIVPFLLLFGSMSREPLHPQCIYGFIENIDAAINLMGM
ncbi:hypothetical protein D3C78_1040090 [compost metagenome]